MTMRPNNTHAGVMRVLLSWSSGKDSAWALYQLQQDPNLEVVGLLTTYNAAFDRSAIHGVRRTLVAMQAEAAGLPLLEVPLPWPCSNQDYERIMGETLEQARQQFEMDAIAFGDLFLEDIRAYREERMADTGLEILFPVWGIPTRQLSQQMMSGGLKAAITCIDPKKLPATFAGRQYDQAFLSDLPEDIDPCGENGEFHSFAWDGPMFQHPVNILPGEVVERDGFIYADFVPQDEI